MTKYYHDRCGGEIDLTRKPITCQKCGKVGHAVIAQKDGSTVLWSKEEYQQTLRRKIGAAPNGSSRPGPHKNP